MNWQADTDCFKATLAHKDVTAEGREQRTKKKIFQCNLKTKLMNISENAESADWLHSNSYQAGVLDGARGLHCLMEDGNMLFRRCLEHHVHACMLIFLGHWAGWDTRCGKDLQGLILPMDIMGMHALTIRFRCCLNQNKGSVHHGQTANSSQCWHWKKNNHTLTFSPMGNLAWPVNLTPDECLWRNMEYSQYTAVPYNSVS